MRGTFCAEKARAREPVDLRTAHQNPNWVTANLRIGRHCNRITTRLRPADSPKLMPSAAGVRRQHDIVIWTWVPWPSPVTRVIHNRDIYATTTHACPYFCYYFSHSCLWNSLGATVQSISWKFYSESFALVQCANWEPPGVDIWCPWTNRRVNNFIASYKRLDVQRKRGCIRYEGFVGEIISTVRWEITRDRTITYGVMFERREPRWELQTTLE